MSTEIKKIVHDYRIKTWGHAYSTHKTEEDGKLLRMTGHGPKADMGYDGKIEAGHYLLFSNGGGTTRYIVEEIEYYKDPKDMWKATVRFAPVNSREELEAVIVNFEAKEIVFAGTEEDGTAWARRTLAREDAVGTPSLFFDKGSKYGFFCEDTVGLDEIYPHISTLPEWAKDQLEALLVENDKVFATVLKEN